jgi:hypothetical protein
MLKSDAFLPATIKEKGPIDASVLPVFLRVTTLLWLSFTRTFPKSMLTGRVPQVRTPVLGANLEGSNRLTCVAGCDGMAEAMPFQRSR